ncbi:MAG: hypothetical protein KAG14_01470, partial [Mycoplasmataceae bacterium]|nr:hypothetical protein [Mycoplasmataceae bacterium]
DLTAAILDSRIKMLKNAFSKKRHFNHLKLSQASINAIVNILSNKDFIKFEKTKAYLDWKNAGTILEQAKVATLHSQQTLNHSLAERTRLANLKITLANEKKRSEASLKLATKERDAQKNAFDTAKTDVNTQVPIKNAAFTTQQSSIRAYTTARSELVSLNANIVNVERELNSNVKSRNANIKIIQGLENDITSNQMALIDLKKEKTKLENAFNVLSNSLKTTNTNLTTALKEKNTAQNTIDGHIATIAGFNTTLSTKQTAYNKLVSEYNHLVSSATTPPTTIQTKEILAKQEKVTSMEKEVLNVKKQIKDANVLLVQAKGILATKTTNYNNALAAKTSKQTEYTRADNILVANGSQIQLNEQDTNRKEARKTRLETDNLDYDRKITGNNNYLALWRPKVQPKINDVEKLRLVMESDKGKYNAENRKYQTLNTIYQRENKYRNNRLATIKKEENILLVLNGKNNNGTIQQNIDDIERNRKKVEDGQGKVRGTDRVDLDEKKVLEEKAEKGLATKLDLRIQAKKIYNTRKKAILDIYRKAFR